MGLIGTPKLAPGGDECSIDQSWMRSGRRKYRCWSTTDFDSVHVRNNCGISIFNTHPSDSGMLVTNISVSLDSPYVVFYDSIRNPGGSGSPPANGTEAFQWLIDVTYGPWNPILSTATGDPLAQPLEIKMNGVTYEEPIWADVNGNPIVNTAGDCFDPPVVRDQVRCVLEVTRNESGFSPSTIFGYSNMVNAGVWNGFAAGTVKIEPPQVVPMFSQFSDIVYSRVTYTFEIDPFGWKKEVVNLGTRYLDLTGGSLGLGSAGLTGSAPTLNRFNARDDNGDLVSSPILLAENGSKLRPPITLANIVILPFQVYPSMDFSVLGLDPIFTY